MSARSVVIVAAAALLWGCSGSDTGTERRQSSGATESSSSIATTTTTVAATTTTTSPEEAVKAAYLAYWAMVDRLVQAPNPYDPEIALRVAEPALSDLVSDLASQSLLRRRTQLPVPELNKHDVLTVAIEGDHATVTDCFVDGRIVLEEDGSIFNDDVVSERLEARLAQSAVGWQITAVARMTKSFGVVPCDVP